MTRQAASEKKNFEVSTSQCLGMFGMFMDLHSNVCSQLELFQQGLVWWRSQSDPKQVHPTVVELALELSACKAMAAPDIVAFLTTGQEFRVVAAFVPGDAGLGSILPLPPELSKFALVNM